MYKISRFNNSSKRMIILGKIFTFVFYLVMIPIIVYNLVMITKSFFNSNNIPTFFGYKSFIIVSESMEPTIMTNDYIFVKEVKQEDLKINDIISFNYNNEIITHRIIEITKENGITKYKTKGDNNKSIDKEKVEYRQIEGKYQFKINEFGTFAKIIGNKITLICLLILLIVISYHIVNVNKRKLERKERRYNYIKDKIEKFK